MNKTKKNLVSLTVFLILVMPIFSFAQFQGPCPQGTYNNGTGCVPSGLVPCGGANQPACDFSAFLGLINNVIQFILYALVVPIAAIMFFYAGFKLVTSGGNAEAKGAAKRIFTDAIIGFVVAVGAWAYY